MDSSQHFKRFFISLVALVSITAPCTRAQDCQQNPQNCSASQVISNFVVFDNVATSDSQPPIICERYERTLLSEQGTAAQYNVVYTAANGDSTPINDTCVYEVVTNRMIYSTCANYPNTVFEWILDYVNGNYCFVMHSNKNESTEIKYYYLLNNPDSEDSQYSNCIDKINSDAGGNVTLMRNPQICPTIPPKP